VVRESLGAKRRQWWAGAAVRLLRAVYPSDEEDPGQRGLCARLLPYMQAVFRLVGDEDTEPRVISCLLDRAAGYLRGEATTRSLVPLFERALAIREKVLGPDHPHTASSLNNLAYLLRAQGELAAAPASL
jgi:Tetratricopeptide repeat